MFILLSSEKNEPRSAAAVIGLCRSEAGTALGGCGTRCAQTVLTLMPVVGWPPPGPIKAEGGTLYASLFGVSFCVELLDPASLCRVTRHPHRVRGDTLLHLRLYSLGYVQDNTYLDDAEFRYALNLC